MLRALLALLVLTNLVFLGWAQGWFSPVWPAPRAGETEPARLAAQVAPERVTVLAPAATSAARSAAMSAGKNKAQCGPAGQPAEPPNAASAPLPGASQAAELKPCEPGP